MRIKEAHVEVYTIKPAFRDYRGDIYDIVEDKVQHIGLITFKKKNIERGRHYHKRSTQYSYVVTGNINLIISNIDGSGRKIWKMKPGTYAKIPPRIVHTYVSLSPAVLLDMTTMSRKKDGYEKDTVRVG